MKTAKYTAALLLLLLVTGCQKADEVENTEVSSQAAETSVKAEVQATTEYEPEITDDSMNGINPLTGEDGYPDAAAGKRPVAIMVNNLALSYPQYGISEADIIYEMPVEGGVTRMMAVYADFSSVPDVCSVRSCRYYYPEIAMGMDAIYCHWGAEQVYAVSMLESLGIDHLDGSALENTILFYRDPERVGKYASEHTGYLKGSELPEAIARYGIREYAVSRDTLFTFSQESSAPEESVCTQVYCSYSNSSSTSFSYDENTQQYLMLHNGNPQVDGNTEQQLAFTNVFILQTQVTALDDSNYLRSIALDGGSGYYISQGGMETIRWEKAADTSPIVCYTADGSELTVNVGKSYIGIIGDSRPLQFGS
jgi:hypothetical protein